ncbi:hypothetical protein B9Z55_013541 [Caenorhabditis nigoni]|uniref:Uncharacterized protein n=1 Tax=Caenorhabditis nigoni TaxID=1611254 RepID=A0A2G5U260_9PELO|nr:hypothetical protein B9Z55_013541 [Caenorhabditis nigoni]
MMKNIWCRSNISRKKFEAVWNTCSRDVLIGAQKVGFRSLAITQLKMIQNCSNFERMCVFNCSTIYTQNIVFWEEKFFIIFSFLCTEDKLCIMKKIFLPKNNVLCVYCRTIKDTHSLKI